MKLFGNDIIWLAFSLSVLFSGCGSSTDPESSSEVDKPKVSKLTSVDGLVSNQKLTIGDSIKLKVTIEKNIVVDSVKLTLDGKGFVSKGNGISVGTEDIFPGKFTIGFDVFYQGGKERHSFPIEILSDIVPEELTYQRVAYYTHDPDAYTQGLFYHNGFLYENTGKKGESELRKVELTTGKVVQQTFLSDQYFGEGITLWKDQIVQLTWTSNEGFVYSLDNFEQIKSFNYATEGWGITTLEDELVMSDGSENLYFLDPETLLETHRLKVYDNNGPVDELNELEYIEGAIYANVYQTHDIVSIDPATGKVLTRIDLTGLMNANWNRRIDVLNGIAYDEAGKRLFVTGKWWPRLYEIRLVEKKAV